VLNLTPLIGVCVYYIVIFFIHDDRFKVHSRRLVGSLTQLWTRVARERRTPPKRNRSWTESGTSILVTSET